MGKTQNQIQLMAIGSDMGIVKGSLNKEINKGGSGNHKVWLESRQLANLFGV